MPDPTPAVAPVAAPAAAPAAPAPAAVAAPAAASPAPAPAPAPAPEATDSLLPADAPATAAVPQTDAEKLAAAKALVLAAEAAADPNGGKAWLLHDGVMGQGAKPAWFNTAKYKTVAAQAEAYSHLESRFGSFIGAPPEGKYEFKPPEGIEVSMDHPIMQEFSKWAASKQLSQDGYSELLGMLVQYEAAQQPNMEAIKTRLGDNADARIATVAQWGKANLGNEGYGLLRSATSGANADAVFKVMEQIIKQTATVRMPKPGEDTPSGQASATGLAAAQALHAEKGTDGKRKYDTDPAHAARVHKAYLDAAA